MHALLLTKRQDEIITTSDLPKRGGSRYEEENESSMPESTDPSSWEMMKWTEEK